jgi:methylamine dehydrogenase heavy chain
MATATGSTLRIVKSLTATALGLSLPLLCQGAPSPLPQSPPNVVLPDKPASAHWVWVGDYQWGNYGRSVLYNADSAEVLGMIDSGWEGSRLNFTDRGIINTAMFMSRGFRGQRTDVVTTYDPHTLNPVSEVIVPPKTIRGFQDLNHFSLTDDNRFLLLQLVSPASSVGVVDLQSNQYLGEIETAGCINAMPAGNRRFFAMCGDGSLLAVTITDDGKEASRKRYTRFFDPDADPLHESAMRSGNIWYFVSHRGEMHPVDVSGADFKPLPTWSVAQKDGELTWIPGQPMQTLAIHHRQQRLYVLMHASDLKPKTNGIDFHRQPGTEAWVFDLKNKRRLQRIALKNLTDAIAVSQDDAPLLYASSMYHLAFTIQQADSGKLLHEIPFPSYPNLVQPVD